MTLEIAPSSNVQTGAYPSLAEHPVDRLHRLGFAVTVNTDNRLMSGVSASSELGDVADDVRLVLGRRPDGDRTGADRRRSSTSDERKRLLAEVVRAGVRELLRERWHPAESAGGGGCTPPARESPQRSSLLT